MILDLLVKNDVTLIQLSFEDENCYSSSFEDPFCFIQLVWEQNLTSLLSSCSSFNISSEDIYNFALWSSSLNSSQHKHLLTSFSLILLEKFRDAPTTLNSLSAILTVINWSWWHWKQVFLLLYIMCAGLSFKSVDSSTVVPAQHIEWKKLVLR